MTCKDCMHYDVCRIIDERIIHLNMSIEEVENKMCKLFKDKSKHIELPCAMGTTIYMIVTRKTTSFSYNWDNEHISKVMQMHENQHTFIKTTKLMETNLFSIIEKWNDTVFATKEEAKAKIKELNNG